MRATVLGLILVCLPVILPAQTTDPAKVQELARRFKEGVELENAGKFVEARKIFDGIIAEEPKAPGSLLCAGIASMQLNEFGRAIDYLQKFRVLQPKDGSALVFLIQANQALGRTAQVEPLAQELRAMRAEGNEVKGLTDQAFYERERAPRKDGTAVVVKEFYDEAKDPFLVWELTQLNAAGGTVRDMVISVDHAKDAAAKPTYVFAEYAIKDGQPRQINIYRQEKQRPDYDAFRKWCEDALLDPPKPILIVPMK
jgi:tetratricopeptide (TPR) repeat protein